MAPNSRYNGSPLTRLAECYVLAAIGRLSDTDRANLEKMTPNLHSTFGSKGSWLDAIAAALDLPETMPALINGAWVKNSEIARQHKTVLTPQQFAEMFVDKNFLGK